MILCNKEYLQKYYLQQDGARPHTALSVQKEFSEKFMKIFMSSAIARLNTLFFNDDAVLVEDVQSITKDVR